MCARNVLSAFYVIIYLFLKHLNEAGIIIISSPFYRKENWSKQG